MSSALISTGTSASSTSGSSQRSKIHPSSVDSSAKNRQSSNDSSNSSNASVKPRPNPLRDSHNAKMSKLDYEIENIRTKMNDISAKITQLSGSGTSAGSSSSTSLGTCVAEVREKRQQYSTLLETKRTTKERIATLRELLGKKSKQLQEIQSCERQIQEYERKLGEGNLKIPDERRYLTEISRLRRTQQPLLAVQVEVQKLQEELDSCSAQHANCSGQLDAIRKERDGLQQTLKTLDSQRQDKQATIQALWEEKKRLKERMDSIWAEKKQASENFKAANAQHRLQMERERLRREVAGKKAKIEEEIEILEERMTGIDLSADHELESIDGLLSNLESMFPNSCASSQANASVQTTISSSDVGEKKENASRRVIASGDLIPLERRKEVNFMQECCMNPAANGSSSGGSASGGGAKSKAFKLPINIVSGLSGLGLQLPLNAAAVPKTLEQLKQKRQQVANSATERKAKQQAKKEAIAEQIAGLRQQIVEIDKQAIEAAGKVNE